MTIEVFLTPNTFSGYLQLAHESEWTGRIDISASDNQAQNWSIVFLTGELIWCSGGAHERRRWRRLLYQFCPHISIKEITPSSPWADYYQLGQWVELGLLMPARAKALMQENFAEVFFDIFQQESRGQLTFKTSTINKLTTYLPPIDFTSTLNHSKENWKYWCEAQLENISPNHVFAMTQAQQKQLHKQSFHLYQELVRVIDGEKSLRDVALLLRQPLLAIAVSFFSFFRQGLFEMLRIPDLSRTDVLPPLSTSYQIPLEDLLSHSGRVCSNCGCNNSITAFLCQKCNSPFTAKALPAKQTPTWGVKSLISALLLILLTGAGYFVWQNFLGNDLQKTLVSPPTKTSENKYIY